MAPDFAAAGGGERTHRRRWGRGTHRHRQPSSFAIAREGLLLSREPVALPETTAPISKSRCYPIIAGDGGGTAMPRTDKHRRNPCRSPPLPSLSAWLAVVWQEIYAGKFAHCIFISHPNIPFIN